MNSKTNQKDLVLQNTSKKSFSLRKLRLSLKFRPQVYNLILKLRQCLRKKNNIIKKLKKDLVTLNNEDDRITCKTSSETNIKENTKTEKKEKELDDHKDAGWEINLEAGDTGKTIADQVKEAAQSAMNQTGMVYVESAGMFYDYKTGYYYNSELGLYYHTDTGCYYYYSEEKRAFAFHSYPDTSKITQQNKAFKVYQKKQTKRHNKDIEEDEGEQPPVEKRKKKLDKKVSKSKNNDAQKSKNQDNKTDNSSKVEITDSSKNGLAETQELKKGLDMQLVDEKSAKELEDGECSDTASESSEDECDKSTATESEDNDDSVAKHHPPCMRVIVRQTTLPKLKVGTLFIITKDGGTIGREGDQHTFLLRDQNVSRIHLDVQYDNSKQCYVATDLGSKNGTILNGHRMSESQEHSPTMAIPHGSILQLGETKLLCHIHPGTDTCGHCEPGLIMEANETEKQIAYTRTCSVQKQYQLELARLKNKYGPEPLAIEDGTYNDRAKTRREAVGSSHQAEKTQQTDLQTSITPENKGFKLLEKMGWSKGEGLGKDSQGTTEPIPLVNNESKAGLGAAGSAEAVSVPVAGRQPLRLAARLRPLRPPAKLFRDPLEDDDDE